MAKFIAKVEVSCVQTITLEASDIAEARKMIWKDRYREVLQQEDEGVEGILDIMEIGTYDVHDNLRGA
jgi:hypothetical protein